MNRVRSRSRFITATDLLKVFCPTGEGGGIDPTCSPGGGAGGSRGLGGSDRASHARSTAKEVSDQATDFIYDIAENAANQKQIRPTWSREKLRRAIHSRAESYFQEAYKDDGLNSRIMRRDWDGEFQQQVLVPAVNEVIFSGSKYAGWGPKSIFMRIKNIDKIPYLNAMAQADRKFTEASKK